MSRIGVNEHPLTSRAMGDQLGSPEPSTPDGVLSDCFGVEPYSPSGESEYDESLAVPPSLSVIATDNTDSVKYGKYVVDGAGITNFEQKKFLDFFTVLYITLSSLACYKSAFLSSLCHYIQRHFYVNFS